MRLRQTSPGVARSCWAAVAAVLWTAIGASGCLPPPRMELSQSTAHGSDTGVWWYLPGSSAMRGPIVAVEQRLSPRRVRQWLLDDRGVRCFEYHGDETRRWGPPVSTRALGDDFAVVPSLVRARFGAADEPGWPGPPLPPEQIDRMTGSADLVTLLKHYWAAAQTDPPPGLTPHDVEQAMAGAKITVANLLKSDM